MGDGADFELLRTWPGRLRFPDVLIALTSRLEPGAPDPSTLAGAVLSTLGGLPEEAVFDDLLTRGEFAAAEYLLAAWSDISDRRPADLEHRLESARENRAAVLDRRVRELLRRAEAAGVTFTPPDPAVLAEQNRCRVVAAEAVLAPLESDFAERVEARSAELENRIVEQEQSAGTDAARFASEQMRTLVRAGELVAVQARLDREPPGAPIPEAALPLPRWTNRWTPAEMLGWHLTPTWSRPPELAAWRPSGVGAMAVLKAFSRLGMHHSPEAAADFATALAAFLGVPEPKVVANRAEGGYLTVLHGLFLGEQLARLHPNGKVDLYVSSPGTIAVPAEMASMPPHVAVGPDLATAAYTDRQSTAVLSLADLLRLVVLPSDRAAGLLGVIAPQWPVDALIGEDPAALDRVLGTDAATRWLTLRWITHLSLRGAADMAFSIEQCTGMDPDLLRVVLRYAQDTSRDLPGTPELRWCDDEVLRQALRDDLLARCGAPENRAAWWAALATCDAEEGLVAVEDALDYAEVCATWDGARSVVENGLKTLTGKGLLTVEDAGTLRVPLSGAARSLRPEAEGRLTTLLEHMKRRAPSRVIPEGERDWTPWHRNRFIVTAAYASYLAAEAAGAGPEQLAALAETARTQLADGSFVGLRPATTSLSEVLAALAVDWTDQYPEIHLDLRCPPQVWVPVPEPVVRAVLYEVLDNAAEAMPGDYSWIVQIAVQVESPEIVVDVRDNGPGLPAEAHGRRIFGREWSTRGPGRGAGLHRSRQLLRTLSDLPIEPEIEVLETGHPTLTGAALRLVLPEEAV
ncbi:ATP-binding protein [Amycolatopsis sp. lyj-346]|uniref:ATP-binding protein n=1 Tax=Amycolatopsis sp. lyj-346 TaxID=2789289 RepID=UPI00397A2F84